MSRVVLRLFSALTISVDGFKSLDVLPILLTCVLVCAQGQAHGCTHFFPLGKSFLGWVKVRDITACTPGG